MYVSHSAKLILAVFRRARQHLLTRAFWCLRFHALEDKLSGVESDLKAGFDESFHNFTVFQNKIVDDLRSNHETEINRLKSSFTTQLSEMETELSEMESLRAKDQNEIVSLRTNARRLQLVKDALAAQNSIHKSVQRSFAIWKSAFLRRIQVSSSLILSILIK